MKCRNSLLLLGLVVWATRAEAQTTLRFKFKEGDQLNYVMDQKMKISTNAAGKDLTVDVNQEMHMAWQILKVNEQGKAEVKMKFTSMKMSMDGPMGHVEVDSKNPKELDDPVGKVLSKVVGAIGGMEMTMQMDPTGEISDVKIPEKTRNDLKSIPGAEAMGDLFSDESLKKWPHGGVALPKEPVTKGKTWKTKADMKLPMGQVKGDVLFTYEGPVEKDGKKLEKIALKPTIAIEPTADAGFKMKFKSQEGKGHIYLDNEAGRIVAVDNDNVMEMTIEANDMQIQQKMEQKTTMKLAK